MKDQDKILTDLYRSNEGFTSISAFKQTVKNHGYKISDKKITQFVKSLPDYQILKQPPKIKHYRSISAFSPNHKHQCDLMQMTDDRGKKYALVLIDVYSRYVSAKPLKTKSGPEVLSTLKSIYENDFYLDIPTQLTCDRGKEFKNNTFIQFFESNHVKLIFPEAGDKLKTSLVERVNQTLAAPIYARQTYHEIRTNRVNKKWADMLSDVVIGYNNRIHSSIGITPLQAMSGEKVVKDKNTSKKESNLHPIGTEVRITQDKDKMSRGTDEKYTRETFIVIAHDKSKFPFMHELREKKLHRGKEIQLARLFYFEELLPTNIASLSS